MTQKKKQDSWTRMQGFRKHFGTVFGMSRIKHLYRLDVGNERIENPEGGFINISECQIIFEQEAFDALLGLFKSMDAQRKRELKKEKKDAESKQAKKKNTKKNDKLTITHKTKK